MKKLLILTLSFLLVACSQETKKSAPVEGKVIDASPLRQLNEKEVECLARNIFYEAGVEPYQGKLAVARNQALEEAAVECDKRAHAGDAGALMAARAIRALKGAKE